MPCIEADLPRMHAAFDRVQPQPFKSERAEVVLGCVCDTLLTCGLYTVYTY